jgi:hypothetical protein
MAELAATTFCFQPKRVPLPELLGEVPEQAPAATAACTAGPIPEGPCPVCPRLAAEFEPWRQAGSWKALCLWDINPRLWLQAYLQACAEAGGQAPAELDRFLPWKMSEGQRQEWSLGPDKAGEDSS